MGRIKYGGFVEKRATANVGIFAIRQNSATLQGDLERQGIRLDFCSVYNFLIWNHLKFAAQ